MLDLHEISLNNFRSYKGKHHFKFPTENGLYFLTGLNEVEPSLGSNGAGKSTLLDAITWILYGRTTRGLKANEVVSWGATSCHAELDLTIRERFTVKRTQKPNGIFLDGTPISPEDLQAKLGLTFEAFVSSVINPQFGLSFFARPPAAKLTLFSEIMNLDYWLAKSDTATIAEVALVAELSSVERAISKQQNLLDAVNGDLAWLKQVKDKFEADKRAELAALAGEITDLEKSTPLENLPKISEGLKIRIEKAEVARDKVLHELMALAKDKSKAEGGIEVVKQQLDDLGTLKGKCPTCYQKIDTDVVGHESDQRHRQHQSLKALIRECGEALERAKRNLVKANLYIDRLLSDLEACLDKESELVVTKTEIKRLKEKHVELKEQENPHTDLYARKQIQRGALLIDLNQFDVAKRQLEADQAATSFWVKGFKQIRLFIIEQAFATLELEVNNCLAQLGMPEWQGSFDVERENKAGGGTKGFIVLIQHATCLDPVRWENWSGGESQRLQLAGDLGLSNLIMHQAGLSNAVEFYDEASTHLSPEGMLDLANTLHQRAISENKKIWIVDHSSIANFGDFKGIITARKTENGSDLTYESC